MYDTRRLFFGLLLGLLVMQPVSARAELTPPAVVVSEVAWAGSARSAADEWLELANRGSTDVDVGGWFLAGVGTSGSAIVIAQGTTIHPGSTLLISNYATGNEKTTLTTPPGLVTTSLSIPNDKLDIVLAMPDGLVVDEVRDAGTPDAGSSASFASMERNLSDLTWFTAQTSINLLDNQSGTPGIVTSLIAPTSDTEVGAPEAPPVLADEPSTESQTIDQEEETTGEAPVTAIGLSIPTETIPEEQPLITGSLVEENINDVLEALPTIPVEDTPAEDTFEASPTTINEEVVEAIPVATEETITIEISSATVPEVEPIETKTLKEEFTPGEIQAPEETATYTLDIPVTPQIPITTVETSSPSVEEMSSDAITPQCQPVELHINEILSSPNSGETEWIELANSAQTSVDLTGCIIADASGAQTALSDIVPAGGFIVISSPKGKLNNDGDTVVLIASTGAVIESISYGAEELKAPQRGMSIGRKDDGSWESTRNPTPQMPNAFELTEIADIESSEPLYEEPDNNETPSESDAEMPEASVKTQSTDTHDGNLATSSAATADRVGYVAAPTKIVEPVRPTSTRSTKATSSKKSVRSSPVYRINASEISQRKDDDKVIVTGTAVGLPGTFGNQLAYLNGLELYFHSADWPVMNIGDVIEVTGVVSSANGNRRVKISSSESIAIIGSEAFTPVDVSRANFTDLPHGSLVTLHGVLDGREGDVALITQDGDTYRVSLPAGATFPLGGTSISMTGILRRDKNGTTIAARSEEDFVVSLEPQAVVGLSREKGSDMPWGGLALTAVTLGLLGTSFFLAKRKASHSSLQPITV